MARPVTVLPLEYYPHWPERGEADTTRITQAPHVESVRLAVARLSAERDARGQCQRPGVAARATSSAPRRRRNFQHERREYALQGQRREERGSLSPVPWIGGTHAK